MENELLKLQQGSRTGSQLCDSKIPHFDTDGLNKIAEFLRSRYEKENADLKSRLSKYVYVFIVILSKV
jgi:hypothetical protein